eukprot:Clim_evm73s156 gene=Clim_evmTU73s156
MVLTDEETKFSKNLHLVLIISAFACLGTLFREMIFENNGIGFVSSWAQVLGSWTYAFFWNPAAAAFLIKSLGGERSNRYDLLINEIRVGILTGFAGSFTSFSSWINGIGVTWIAEFNFALEAAPSFAFGTGTDGRFLDGLSQLIFGLLLYNAAYDTGNYTWRLISGIRGEGTPLSAEEVTILEQARSQEIEVAELAGEPIPRRVLEAEMAEMETGDRFEARNSILSRRSLAEAAHKASYMENGQRSASADVTETMRKSGHSAHTHSGQTHSAHDVTIPEQNGEAGGSEGKDDENPLKATMNDRFWHHLWGVFIPVVVIVLSLTLPLAIFDDRREAEVWIARLGFAPPGALLRWQLARFNNRSENFKWGTFAANILAVIVITAAQIINAEQLEDDVPSGAAKRDVVLGIIGGFCGSLSTISSFVHELHIMEPRPSFVYAAVTIAIAFLVMLPSYKLYGEYG